MISALAFLFGSYLPVELPPAANWTCLSDKTERGGASVGFVQDTVDGIRFTGSLGSIPGRDGKPVGFALARIPYSAKGDGLKIDLMSERDLTVLILVAPPISEPARTYQHAVRLRAGKRESIQIGWKSFVATVRGKPDSSAPRLDPTTVTSFAVELTRSTQTEKARYEPFEFSVELR